MPKLSIIIIEIIILLFWGNPLKSQNITIKMKVLTGGQLEYFFDTQAEFTNGITKSNYTSLQIYYNDSTNLGAANPSPFGWRLKVKVNSADLSSFFGSQTISANTLEVEAVDDYGNGSGIWNQLSNTYITIATWDSGNMSVLNSLETIYLSYRCGNSISLAGVTENEYRGLMEFVVEENN